MRSLVKTISANACLALVSLSLVSCASSSNSSGSGQNLNPIPSLTSISPTSAIADSSAFSLTVTGSNFVSSSRIEWNNVALPTTYVDPTTLTAQINGADLQNGEIVSVTVRNPPPGGGESSAIAFTVAANFQVSSLSVPAIDLAWDPVNQVIYLALPGINGANANSVQILNPKTGSLGASAYAASEPYLLSVSANSKYLYVAQGGASTVQAMTLPELGSGFTIDLGSSEYFGPYYAMDLQAAPNSDSLVAVVRGTPGFSPEEEGGVVIYDDGTALPKMLCGWTQSGCPDTNLGLYDSIQWNSSGTEMFATNNETTAFDFYTIQVDSSGFGAIADYPGVLTYFGGLIHYDATTGYVYDDNGQVVNPSTGELVGSFDEGAYGLADVMMVPDGALGQAFVLGETASTQTTNTYTIVSYDIQTFAPISSITIPNVVGEATSFIRWGSSGLAFAANNGTTGAVYLVTGPFVGGGADEPKPAENAPRTWRRHSPLDIFHKQGTSPQLATE
jgi:hypothetical protein